MAGVGFELNKLFAKNSKFSRIGACFWSSLSCCGSMILSFILLFLINIILNKYNITSINSNVFTTYITNIVLFSMLIYSVFSHVIARYISDLIYENKLDKIMPSFYGIVFVILLVSNIVFVPILIFSKLSFIWIILLSMLLSTLICTWVVVGYVTILKYYKKICLAFVYGFLFEICLIILFFLLDMLSYEILFISMIIGYGGIFCKLYLILYKYLKSNDTSTFEILKYFNKYGDLAFSGFFITAGTLLPFYIFWFSDIGIEVSFFFRSAPFYDLPAIIAYLTTIFTTIYFVAVLEPNFYPYYKKYFNLLNQNGSYQKIKETKEKMIEVLRHQLHQLITVQGIITLLATIVLSKFIYLLNIGMSQSMLGVYRLLCIGYCLLAIGNSLVLIIIYFADYKSSLRISFVFFIVTILISFISSFLPYYFYGIGIIIGSLVMCLLAIKYLEDLLNNLEYFVLSKKGLYVKKEKFRIYDLMVKMVNKVMNIFDYKFRIVLYLLGVVVLIVYLFNLNIFSMSYFLINDNSDEVIKEELENNEIDSLVDYDSDNVIVVNNMIELKHSASNKILSNPGVGFAPWAKSDNTVKLNTRLVYVDMSWREIEAIKGKYEFEKFEKRNNLDIYRKQGRNVVFRLYLDYPSDKKELDIPDWLYEEIEEDGTWYDNDYGKGFSPNYSNKVLISNYKRLIDVLGKKYGNDNFFMYIELGGIGHWGEWHVNYDDGIDRLPKYNIRKNYVEPFINNFKYSKFLMRYPVIEAEKYGTGLYNDMIGHDESTNYWFKMMEGGLWSQTEEFELVNMLDSWKKNPVGGEFTSSLSDNFMLKENIDKTIEQLKKSHQSFIGPKVIKDMSLYSNYEESLNKILKILGHRLYVSNMRLKVSNNVIDVDITFNNDGIAPIYDDVDVILHIYDENNEIYTKNINEYIDINSVITDLNGKFTINNMFSKGNKYKIGISLDDSVSNKPVIEMAMNDTIDDKIYLIGEFSWN